MSVIDPCGVLIQAVLAGLAVTPTVKAYYPAPMSPDTLPAAVIEVPDIQRQGIEIPESQIGSRDWHLDFPVTLYFDLAEAATAQAQATATVEAFITAIDSHTLQVSDATIIDAKVTESKMSIIADQARPLLAYECHLELLKLV